LDGRKNNALRHRRWSAVIGTAAGMVSVAIFATLYTGEPTYKGRTITSWLQQLCDTSLDETKRLEEAKSAVRAMNRQKNRRSFERLETRQMMAGNVSAAVVGTNLTITGDNLENYLTLHEIGDTGRWEVSRSAGHAWLA